MNARPAFPADPAPHDAPEPARVAVERAQALALEQLAVLKRLAEIGMEIAVAVEGEAKAWTPPEAADDPPDPALMARRGRRLQALAMAYARAARAVRLTLMLMLQSKVLRELEQVERQAQLNLPSETRQRLAATHRARQARKLKIARIVRRMAEEEGADAETLEAVEACERLDEDAYGDVLVRPMREIVAHLCRDLRLDPDWSRWAAEAWAQPDIASAAPAGSPFAGMGTEGGVNGLERFPAKWTPVRRKKARKIKNLERRADSIGANSALAATPAPWPPPPAPPDARPDAPPNAPLWNSA